MVEKADNSFEAARDIFLTLVFKMQTKQNDKNWFNKVWSWTPKHLELTQVKVHKDGQEEPMEQMMI